jgi:hypothetical protein
VGDPIANRARVISRNRRSGKALSHITRNVSTAAARY